MKHRELLFVALCLGVAACQKDGPADPGANLPADTVRALTQQERQVAAASNSFAFELMREVNAAETAKPNLMISPLSVSMALGMTLNGALGSTYDALRATLGFGGMTQAEINTAYQGLIGQLHARDPKVEFKLANSVWYDDRFFVQQTFTDTLKHYFDAEVKQLDFASSAAPRTISGWAEEKTGGRIKDLIKQIDPNEVMFLVNAVYFKAPWTRPFVDGGTQSGPFRRSDGTVVSVPMMHVDAGFRMLVNSEVKAVELLYADSAFSMVVWAPASGTALAPAANMLDASRWESMIASMTMQRVELRVAKFRFEYEKQLNDALSALGMGIAFDVERANFDRISNRDDLYISRVSHKSFIDVHELGTEAAAATAVGIGVTSLPPQLSFDQAFFFAIRERSTGSILFIGRVDNPT